MKTKIQKIYKAVYNSIKNEDNLNKFKVVLARTVQQCYPEATRREKAAMYRSALQLRNRGDTRRNLEQIIKSENLIQRNGATRAKMKNLKTQVKESRERPEPVIFYLCSHHANPAEDHKDWEGRIYVDRFWLSTVQDVYDDSAIRAVKRYIRDNDVRTIQWVTGEPVYLVSRCYCKHYFIPLNTSEVLNNSLKEVRKKHPEGIMKFRLLDPSEREKRFQSKRILVSRAIENIGESTGYCSKLSKKHHVKT